MRIEMHRFRSQRSGEIGCHWSRHGGSELYGRDAALSRKFSGVVAAIARRHDSRRREKAQRHVHLAAFQLQAGWFCDSHDLDLPGTHRPPAKENPRLTTEKILPSSASRFSVESLMK